MQRLRQQFTALGTVSQFEADIVGVHSSGGTSTGTAALAFSDSAAARANEPDQLSVDTTEVSGSVLTLSLHLSQPRVRSEAVVSRALGFDVCL